MKIESSSWWSWLTSTWSRRTASPSYSIPFRPVNGVTFSSAFLNLAMQILLQAQKLAGFSKHWVLVTGTRTFCRTLETASITTNSTDTRRTRSSTFMRWIKSSTKHARRRFCGTYWGKRSICSFGRNLLTTRRCTCSMVIISTSLLSSKCNYSSTSVFRTKGSTGKGFRSSKGRRLRFWRRWGSRT